MVPVLLGRKLGLGSLPAAAGRYISLPLDPHCSPPPSPAGVSCQTPAPLHPFPCSLLCLQLSSWSFQSPFAMHLYPVFVCVCGGSVVPSDSRGNRVLMTFQMTACSLSPTLQMQTPLCASYSSLVSEDSISNCMRSSSTLAASREGALLCGPFSTSVASTPMTLLPAISKGWIYLSHICRLMLLEAVAFWLYPGISIFIELAFSISWSIGIYWHLLSSFWEKLNDWLNSSANPSGWRFLFSLSSEFLPLQNSWAHFHPKFQSSSSPSAPTN